MLGGLLVALAALITFLAVRGAGDDDAVAVVVADRAMERGHVIAVADVRLVDIEIDGGVTGLFGDIDAVVGRQITGTVSAGEFVVASDTTPATTDEVIEVTVAVRGDRAASGLTGGDRVDVFATWGSSTTELVAVDAVILSAGAGGDDLLGDSDTLRLRLAVTDIDQVEALVHANVAGDLSVVRAAIGTETADVGRTFDPDAARGTTNEEPNDEPNDGPSDANSEGD